MVCFFWVLDPLYFGGHNFLNFIPFLAIFSALNVPIGWVEFFLDTKNNGALPLDPTYHECLSVRSPIGLPNSCNSIATQFATKEQLKGSTHMFCLQIPCYKLYKKGLFFYVLTLKYLCHMSNLNRWMIIKSCQHDIMGLRSSWKWVVLTKWQWITHCIYGEVQLCNSCNLSISIHNI
jgi:hypothetical protein